MPGQRYGVFSGPLNQTHIIRFDHSTEDIGVNNGNGFDAGRQGFVYGEGLNGKVFHPHTVYERYAPGKSKVMFFEIPDGMTDAEMQNLLQPYVEDVENNGNNGNNGNNWYYWNNGNNGNNRNAPLYVMDAPYIGVLRLSLTQQFPHGNAIGAMPFADGDELVRLQKNNNFIFRPDNLQEWFDKGTNTNPLTGAFITQDDIERFVYEEVVGGGRRRRTNKKRRSSKQKKSRRYHK